ncbi:sigma-E processing peptidase SpoIIGA [Bacillus sp. T33-2]|uniref:sigma-E processing peptidase SpoIIGA n=1 Tax=Bacillus sp. T33-2 TaxID=2054168 RepID=UPI000C779959|nr:sigma-E processing peptidase SpoIIGA [Bacillus sp. T33-2]PLR97367.1 sigma-E processing peptidase SpoIIGA [Bacillus sp. T33-2]
MTVYLDVIWALNLLFDALLIYLTAVILKRKIRLSRLFLGALTGSILILLSITPLHAIAGVPAVKLLFSVLMVLCAFGYRRLSYFIKGLMALYFTTFLAGGTLTGVHYFIHFDMDLSSAAALANIKGFGDPISWLFVLLGFPLAWHFSKKNIEQAEMAKIHYEQLVGVKISMPGLELALTGLIDSGNQLYDPISKTPVMFVSVNNLPDGMPEVLRMLAGDPEAVFTGEESFPEELESRMRIIPFSVVGRAQQLVIAVKPDSVIIEKDDETVQVEKSLVSFTMQELSADGSFHCIVHPKMLTAFTVKVS